MEEGRSTEPETRKGKAEAVEEWTTEEKKERLADVKELSIVSRSIDYGLTVNGMRVLMKYIKALYPGMTVKKENKEDHKTHLLDMNLVVHMGQIRLSTYDKRDDVPFSVRSYPNREGYLPCRKPHAVLVGQLRSFALGCDH